MRLCSLGNSDFLSVLTAQYHLLSHSAQWQWHVRMSLSLLSRSCLLTARETFGQTDFLDFNQFLEDFHIFGTISGPLPFEILETVYNSDNWEPEFMTIFVIWQLIVTLDSIRNSCVVFEPFPHQVRTNCDTHFWKQKSSLTNHLQIL